MISREANRKRGTCWVYDELRRNMMIIGIHKKFQRDMSFLAVLLWWESKRTRNRMRIVTQETGPVPLCIVMIA